MSTAMPLSLLVVDDHRDGADSLAELLALHGHYVRVAYTASDAEVEALDLLPDVVIVDVGRQNAYGFDLVRAFADLDPRPLIITVTGYSHLEGRSRRVGSDGHFLKSSDPDWIVRVLANYAETVRADAAILV